jgi:hypothetical protein
MQWPSYVDARQIKGGCDVILVKPSAIPLSLCETIFLINRLIISIHKRVARLINNIVNFSYL